MFRVWLYTTAVAHEVSPDHGHIRMTPEKRLERLQVLRHRTRAVEDHGLSSGLAQKRQVIRGIVVAMNDGDGSHLSDEVEDRIDRWTVQTRRPAGDLFGKLLFLEMDFAKAIPDAWIQVDHFLDVVSRPRVFQIERAHQRIDSRAVCIW